MNEAPSSNGRPSVQYYSPGRPSYFKKAKSEDYIDNKFNGMDYDTYENIPTSVGKYGASFFPKVEVARHIYILLLGTCVALFSIMTDDFIRKVIHLRLKKVKSVSSKVKSEEMKVYGWWYLMTVALALFGSIPVIWLAPAATGGGISRMYAYLNGVRIKNMMTPLTFIVKYFSVMCMVTAGLAAGYEDSVIHLGAMIGAFFCYLASLAKGSSLSRCFDNDIERSKFAAAGMAAALVCTMGTPIGGMIFVLELSTIYWSLDFTVCLIFCGVAAIFTKYVFHYIDQTFLSGSLYITEIQFFDWPDIQTLLKYYWFELPLFIFMGIVGGVLGSIWNQIFRLVQIVRKRIKNKYLNLLDTFIVSSLTVIGIAAVFKTNEGECIPLNSDGNKFHEIPMYCNQDKEYNALGMVHFDRHRSILWHLYHTEGDAISLKAILSYLVYYIFMTALTSGAFISGGMIMPQLVIGGLWGRLFARAIVQAIPEAKNWATPTKYALLGGASQLSATFRLALSISVILSEAVGSTFYLIPLIVTCLPTRWTAEIFSHSFLSSKVYLRGMPVIPAEPPPLSVGITALDILRSPVYTLKEPSTETDISNALFDTYYHAFPVTVNKKLVGLIARSKLIHIIKARVPPQPFSFLTWLRQNFIEDEVSTRDITRLEGNETISLTPYMNPSPYCIIADMSLNRTQRIFCGLGLRTLIVVSRKMEVVGIITRKDLARYRMQQTLCYMRIQRLDIRR